MKPLEQKIIKEYLSGHSKFKLSKKYKYGYHKLMKLLKDNHIDLKPIGFFGRKEYDRNYFKKIDNHDKAYWLGFIYADGNVCGNCLQISIMDKGHLDKFKKSIKADHLIRHENINNDRIGICQPEIVEDLNKLGVYPRKSLTLSFPSEKIVPEKFINSFMLGCFDGDGGINIYKPKIGNAKWNIGLISTYDFCNKFNKILTEKCNLFESKIIKYKRIPDKDILEIRICGVYSDRLKRIYDFLYKDFKFPLKRKKNKFIEVIKNNPKEPYHSQYYGIYKSFGKWQAQIKIDKNLINLGRYDNEIDAAKAFDKYLIDNNRDLRYLNFPQ